jgi:hypothetical protein
VIESIHTQTAYSRIFIRRCREEAHAHSTHSIKSTCCQKRAFSLVSCIFSSSAHIHAHPACAHAHMDTLRIFARKPSLRRKRAYSRGSFRANGRFFEPVRTANDLVKFASKNSQIPSLLIQQKDLVKFASKNSQIPSQLKQQKDLGDFTKSQAHQTRYC